MPTMLLFVRLSDEEKREKQDQISLLLKRKKETAQRQKKVAAAFRRKAARIEDQIEALNTQVQDGQEQKEVEVYQEIRGAFSCIIRTDTEELVSRRRLTASEKERTSEKPKKKQKSKRS